MGRSWLLVRQSRSVSGGSRGRLQGVFHGVRQRGEIVSTPLKVVRFRGAASTALRADSVRIAHAIWPFGPDTSKPQYPSITSCYEMRLLNSRIRQRCRANASQKYREVVPPPPHHDIDRLRRLACSAVRLVAPPECPSQLALSIRAVSGCNPCAGRKASRGRASNILSPQKTRW